MSGNYDQLLERICTSGGVEREELERKIEAKRAKLSGLISKEGAAQIVAAELGVSFEGERLKISELTQGMRRANVVGKITRLFDVREFHKNGKDGKIGSFLMGDDAGNIRVVLWDVAHIKLIEEKTFKEGDVVEISNASVRNGELHLSGFSDIAKSGEKIESVQTERSFSPGELKDAQVGKGMKVRAVIVQSFEPKYFDSKQKAGEKGVLLNFVVDDGTETMRAVMFTDALALLGFDKEELFDADKFNAHRATLLGEEKFFTGSFRMNTYFNRIEFSVNGVEDVKLDELVKELEAKA